MSKTLSYPWCAPKRAGPRDMPRALVIAWKELLQLRRDRMTLAMMVLLPLLQLTLFG